MISLRGKILKEKPKGKSLRTNPYWKILGEILRKTLRENPSRPFLTKSLKANPSRQSLRDLSP